MMERKEKIIEVLQAVLLMVDGVSEEKLKELFEHPVSSKASYIYNFLNSYFK